MESGARDFWTKPRTDGQCEVIVNRGDHRMSIFQPCGRLAEKDKLCSLHIKIAARREKSAATDRERRSQDEQIQKEGSALARRLGGKESFVYYNSHGAPSTWRYQRKLVVPFDVLKALLAMVDRI